MPTNKTVVVCHPDQVARVRGLFEHLRNTNKLAKDFVIISSDDLNAAKGLIQIELPQAHIAQVTLKDVLPHVPIFKKK